MNDQPPPSEPAPPRQSADPGLTDPTSWPAQPDPTAGPAQPTPATGPAQPYPTAGPAQPYLASGASQPGAAYAGYPPPPGGLGYTGYQVQPERRTNGFAVASLILGIVGGGLLSIIFGIVALVQIRKRGQSGRGLAIGGLVLSGVWVLVLVGAVTYGIMSGAGDDTNSAADTTAVTKLSPGNCINDLKESDSVKEMPVVPCALPHDGEVFAVFDLAAGPWPGDTAVQQQAEKRCKTEFKRYASGTDEKLELYYLHPLRASWSQDRGVTCVATDPAGPRTGSLRD